MQNRTKLVKWEFNDYLPKNKSEEVDRKYVHVRR